MPCLAQASTVSHLPEAPGYVHEIFTVEDGLPAAGIVQTAQTRDGYLWLATFDGLVRFDGTRFEVFDTERVPALGSNRIVELLVSRDGALWLRTEAGHVARWAGGLLTGCSLPAGGRDGDCSLPHAGAPHFTLLGRGRGGSIWIGGRSGLFRVDGTALRRIPGLDLKTGVQAFLEDQSGRLWVGTSEGLWMGRPGRFVQQQIPPDVLGGGVTGLVEGSAGAIWVATKRGVGRFRGGSLRLEVEGSGYLDQDAAGGVWIAAGDRLLRFRNGRFEDILSAEGSMPALVPGRSARLDPEGTVWMAWANALLRNGRPVLRLPPTPAGFTSVTVDREGTVWVPESAPGRLHALRAARVATLAEGLTHPSVYPVYEDHDGSIWAGGFGSVAVLQPAAGRFRPLPFPGDPQQTALAFLRDGSGTFWVGTTQGLHTLDASGRSSPAGPEALRTTAVRALHEDARGVLWAGTEIGLFRREPLAQTTGGGRWTWISAADGLPHPWIRVIRETSDGALWLGTNGGGVIRYFPGQRPGQPSAGRFTAITRAQGLSSNLVRGIFLAPDGHLWIATEDAGVNRLDAATLERGLSGKGGPEIATVGEHQGLSSGGIHQIVADGFSNLWMSSNQGIFRASLRDLNAVADGRLERLECVAYAERDGMRNREANGGIQDAGFRDLQGRIWFPTQHGVVRIEPRRTLERQPPPLAFVAGVRVGDEEMPVTGGTVRLLPHQRSFALELSAPSFRAPERQKFLFRLLPYDRDWIDAGTRRTAFYTKVPPGTYTFQVLASGPDGGWSERPGSVRLEIVPRFWETRWFFILSVLAAAAAVAAVARLWAARQRAQQRRLELLVEERTAAMTAQAEKLRELDRLKSQFFANVSHELRTPLTLILGPLGDVLEGRFGPVGGELRRQLATAGRNAQRLLTLVDQLLDVARLDAGRLQLRVRRCDLAALVRQRVEAMLPLAERREIDLSLEVPPEAVAVWCDEAQIEKVLENLLSNALKFTPRGGWVQVALLAPPGADRVRVCVRDNGPGIPADQVERVFERFYQVKPLALRWPGVGIGLALSRQLVELHHGSIAVESTPGEGSCFTVTLLRGQDHFPEELLEEGTPARPIPSSSSFVVPPAVFDTPPPISRDTVPDLDEDRTTVLVVEDNPEVRAYIRRHLEPDYRVMEAADGAEGLAIARQLVPDLVVSDVMMPGLDGNALFRSLREDPELELVPVVLLTAKASAESRIQGLRDGVDDYLVKPFDPRELKARVGNLIASRKRLLERLGSAAPAAAAPPRPLKTLRVSEVQVSAADEVFLARVQGIIEQRLGDSELSVEALADAAGCDRSYLLRKLRALTGETPSGLIRSLRLQRAEQLLRASAGTVSEIAYGVGFKSVAHFSNAFQEKYGERPSAFAARYRAG
jgi:signal transduction histidine kinase/ligand-binding sensor domain-containing protein/DNA-binding response OmpR family regulator